MPFIEIASVNSPGLNLRQEDFTVTIMESKQLKSPRRLFNNFLKIQDGTVIQIGNPDIRNEKDSLFYAGELIDWDFEPIEIVYFPSFDKDEDHLVGGENQQFRFKFLDQFRNDIDNLLKAALESSPVKKGFLLSDYYFGPGNHNREVLFGISDLWSQHDEKGLMFNTMYELNG